ncbi:MAG TPA: class I SAM-dependent methyltransferase [Nitrospiria bacterium]|nr:class I SAM-dependent methyltransferase [Nitrospiria bacterium]
MDKPTIVTSYEPYSDEPEYLEANRAFINTLPIESCSDILDLACGTGILSVMMLQAHPKLRIVQSDLSHESLLLTRSRLNRSGFLNREPFDFGRSFGLVEASADTLPIRDSRFDAVVMGNAIHILPDTDLLLREIRRVLRPGGLLAFNSSFYAGTFSPGTEKFYHQWMIEALRFIKNRDEELKRNGREGIRRVRGRVAAAFSKQWPTLTEWCERLGKNGFRIRSHYERTVMMDQRSFETVGAYAGLACVLLSGYPVTLACEALQAASGPALAAVNMKSVPRLWLEVAALVSDD